MINVLLELQIIRNNIDMNDNIIDMDTSTSEWPLSFNISFSRCEADCKCFLTSCNITFCQLNDYNLTSTKAHLLYSVIIGDTWNFNIHLHVIYVIYV